MGAPAELLARLDASLAELHRVRFAVPEDEPGAARGALFGPRLARRLDEALALVEEAHARYRSVAAAAPGAPRGPADPGAAELPGQEIVDLLGLSRRQLSAARQDLAAAVAQRDPMRVTSSCDSGLRTLRRTLTAIEATIHDFEGLPPPQRPWPDLETSLRTREVYARLRRGILAEPAPREAELADLLAGVHDRLASFRELDLWPLLRFDDRVAMRELRRRLARWVTSEDHDPAAGRRLWEEARTFAGRLGAVSHRAELRHHDRAVLRRTWHALFGRTAHAGALGREQLQQLESLRGLDEDLDRLLDARERIDLGRWEEVLGRLLQELSAPVEQLATGAPAGAPAGGE